MGKIESSISTKLTEAFDPQLLQVSNESHMHAVPENSETHFKVILVSNAFDLQSKVRRHQAVYGALREELAGPVHALALHLYTNAEWQAREGTAPVSPECHSTR